jgi:hypothetical protein
MVVFCFVAGSNEDSIILVQRNHNTTQPKKTDTQKKKIKIKK